MSVLEDDLAAGLVRLYGDVQSDLFHKICTNANYTQRVLFILKTQKGSHSARVGLGELGLKAAKENRNVDDYTSIWNALGETEQKAIGSYDHQFVTFCEDEVASEEDLLVTALHQEKLTEVMSNTRPALLQLAMLLTSIGHYSDALLLLRQHVSVLYSAPLADTNETAFAASDIPVILGLLMTPQRTDVLKTVLSSFPLTGVPLCVAAGTVAMLEGRFADALQHWTQITPQNLQQSALRTMVSMPDISLYAALTSMTLPAQQQLETHDVFRYLSQLRNLYPQFYNCEYFRSFKELNAWESKLCLDPWIAVVAPALFTAIRNKALLHFVKTFSRIRFQTISETFHIPLDSVGALLARLIQNEDLEGRLDYANQILIKH